MKKIIVAEQNSILRRVMSSCIEDMGVSVSTAGNKEELLSLISPQVKVILLDQSFLADPNDSFLTQLSSIIALKKIILLSHESSIEKKKMWKNQSFGEVLFKPFSLDNLEAAVTKISPDISGSNPEKPQINEDIINLENLPSAKRNLTMKRSLNLIKSISSTDTTVILMGESGVGKEIFARYIHALSKRGASQFVGINCASVPANLLESELFGSEKGSFTGSTSKRLGKFEVAQGGSILLDEISEMDLNLQAKLLRVVQEKEMFRIGGSDSIQLDVRVIAATNRDLREWVQKGLFREDLFYRLNVVSIHVPPLRDRKEDIPVLARHILKKISADNPSLDLTLSMDAIEALCRYDWPGNIRELENILTRTAFLSKSSIIDQIQFDHEPSNHSRSLSFDGTLDEMERVMIRSALEKNSGNRIRAAKQLGISVRTLRNKLRQYREEVRLSGLADNEVGHTDITENETTLEVAN